tara:strand:- start:239 stop:394 length:156 start_codon:yes stop_codon:yes gene_type:complete
MKKSSSIEKSEKIIYLELRIQEKETEINKLNEKYRLMLIEHDYMKQRLPIK